MDTPKPTLDPVDAYFVSALADIPARATVQIRVDARFIMVIIESKVGGYRVTACDQTGPRAAMRAADKWECARRAVMLYRDSVEWVYAPEVTK